MSVSVRTGGWCHSHAKPSRTSRHTCGSRAGGSNGGIRIRAISTIANPISTACATNGTAIPIVNNNAPTAGPSSWLAVRKHAITRAAPIPRSALSTTIGSSVPDAVSANTSATPNASKATSVMPMVTASASSAAASTASTSTRSALAVTTIARRSTRSASTPA